MSAVTLSERQRQLIAHILAPYASRIERVAVFGSRGIGTARVSSDIDLVLYGELGEREIDRLWTLFDESALSVSVDVVAYSDDLYPPLKRHIDAVARTVFDRPALQHAAAGTT